MERLMIEYKPETEDVESLQELQGLFTDEEIVAMAKRYQAAQEHARNYRDKAKETRKYKEARLKELEAKLAAAEQAELAAKAAAETATETK